MTWWTIKTWIVGSKTGRIVALALVAILTLSLTIRWYQNTIEERVRQEIRLEQLQSDKDTRDRIDEGIRNTPTTIDTIADWLRERQARQ